MTTIEDIVRLTEQRPDLDLIALPADEYHALKREVIGKLCSGPWIDNQCLMRKGIEINGVEVVKVSRA